jgi:hypothetical protein
MCQDAQQAHHTSQLLKPTMKEKGSNKPTVPSAQNFCLREAAISDSL